MVCKGIDNLSESSDRAHFETLQVSPAAEPEVIAAAYRALARKYHPDRSNAPDAMARMAHINAAYQAVSVRVGRITSGDTRPDPTFGFSARLSPVRVDPAAPLEQIIIITSRMVAVARQRVIDELEGDGLARDIATTLVATALKSLTAGTGDSPQERTRSAGAHVSPDATYDEALTTVMERAKTARDRLSDELVREGLDRATAMELTDECFERVRRKTRISANSDVRLTSTRVDLDRTTGQGCSDCRR